VIPITNQFLENEFFNFSLADIFWDLWVQFPCESDGDCTSETLRGQFHKIGAMEEITATDSRQNSGDRERLERPCNWPVVAEVFAMQRWPRHNLIAGEGVFCTEGAQEMQKAGGGDLV
jgi:hypothetical protein